MRRIDLRHALEKLRGHVRRSTAPGRSVIELPGFLPHHIDQLADRSCGCSGMHGEQQWTDYETRDRCEIGNRVVARTRVHVRVQRSRALVDYQECITVLRAFGRGLSADVAARPAPVID